MLEWGLMENIEFILESEIELGDGGVAGNADITAFGFHTRFWKEDGWLPAVAMPNLIRVPNGSHSSGVDYTARLLVTKSIIPGKFRFHLNPFLKSVNGHNEADARRFQWGTAVGVDYRCTKDFVIIFDYLHRSSDEDHQRNNHALEFGFDWKLAEHHYVAFGTEVGLDGDGYGTNFGAKISYIFSIGGPHLGGGG